MTAPQENIILGSLLHTEQSLVKRMFICIVLPLIQVKVDENKAVHLIKPVLTLGHTEMTVYLLLCPKEKVQRPLGHPFGKPGFAEGGCF